MRQTQATKEALWLKSLLAQLDSSGSTQSIQATIIPRIVNQSSP